MNLKLINTTAVFGLFTLLIFILHTGRGLLIPLIIALVIWYIIIQFTKFFMKIKISKKKISYALALFISIIISAIILYLFFMAFSYSISNIISEAPVYQAKIKAMINYVSRWTEGKLNLNQFASHINVSQIFSSFALIISDILSNTVLILIYLLFLLLEHKTFDYKLKGICKTEKLYHKTSTIIARVQSDISKFLKIKTAVNAIAGIISYIVLLFFHIQYAEFWGMLIFLFHYVPFIGPIVALVLVMVAVSIQISSLLIFALLGILLTLIQVVVGQFIEPKFMGTHLNLSPIVILLSLAFWGYVWGIIGMFLCVPLMVIITIIFANFPKTKPISVALSATGNTIAD